MVKQIVIFFTTFLMMVNSLVFCGIHYVGNEPVVLLNGFAGKNAFISYVMINGQNYIVKQKKVKTKRMAVVREALAAYIAADLNIAHSVEIIAAKNNMPGKMYPELPATLHTIVPGKTVREQRESRYSKLCLQQRSPESDLLTGRWLTEKIIDQMTWHSQLPIIIALDLFLSNTDRHGGNLFYDSVTDSFYAIDMDCIFRCDIPAFACKKLNLMVNLYSKQFTTAEIEALIIVRDTLKFLLKRYSSKKIIAQLHLFVRQAECTKMVNKIAECEEAIVNNRASVHRLVKLLNKIITNFYN